MSIVCVSGYFDSIHRGYIEYFKDAKILGDKLIVILNTDHQRKRLGMHQNDRKLIVESIKYVDEVIFAIDSDNSVAETLRTIKPTIFAKGSEEISENELSVCEELNITIIKNVGKDLHLYDLMR